MIAMSLKPAWVTDKFQPGLGYRVRPCSKHFDFIWDTAQEVQSLRA